MVEHTAPTDVPSVIYHMADPSNPISDLANSNDPSSGSNEGDNMYGVDQVVLDACKSFGEAMHDVALKNVEINHGLPISQVVLVHNLML